MKAVSNLVTAALLIIITLAIATIISGWVLTFSHQRAGAIENQTEKKLNCVYASMYIYNASYQGNCNCSAGEHNLTITIKNNGNINLDFSKAYIVTATGDSYVFTFDRTTVEVGEIKSFINKTLQGDPSYNCTPFNETSKIDHIEITSLTCPFTDKLDGEDLIMDVCG